MKRRYINGQFPHEMLFISLVIRKCKLNPKHATTTHPLEYLKEKGKTPPRAGHNAEQLECSNTTGG